MRSPVKTHILAAALLAGTSAAALAQANPSASELINSLKPSGTVSETTRGIKPLPPGDASDSNAGPMGTPAAMHVPSATYPEPAQGGPAPALPRMSAPSANLSVDFMSGSATLTPRAMATLDQLGKALTSPQLASYNFKIAGHTDTVGAPDTNQSLSEQRAQAVKTYLESKYSIPDTRLQAVGVGETDLLVATPPNTPNAANRRVQIVNLGQ